MRSGLMMGSRSRKGTRYRLAMKETKGRLATNPCTCPSKHQDTVACGGSRILPVHCAGAWSTGRIELELESGLGLANAPVAGSTSICRQISQHDLATRALSPQ
jgi:hypothetical protein